MHGHPNLYTPRNKCSTIPTLLLNSMCSMSIRTCHSISSKNFWDTCSHLQSPKWVLWETSGNLGSFQAAEQCEVCTYSPLLFFHELNPLHVFVLPRGLFGDLPPWSGEKLLQHLGMNFWIPTTPPRKPGTIVASTLTDSQILNASAKA